MRTPNELGIKKGTKIAPDKGWESNTYYIVEVAFSACNVVFRVIFYSGFVSDGKPCGYNGLLSTKLNDKPEINELYYLKALEKLDLDLGYSE